MGLKGGGGSDPDCITNGCSLQAQEMSEKGRFGPDAKRSRPPVLVCPPIRTDVKFVFHLAAITKEITYAVFVCGHFLCRKPTRLSVELPVENSFSKSKCNVIYKIKRVQSTVVVKPQIWNNTVLIRDLIPQLCLTSPKDFSF